MCAIFGIKIKYLDKEIILKSMLSKISHRGSDSQGLYVNEEIGLGHSRSKIIDLSDAGNQPLSNEKKDIWMVANAEIYNFKELRLELESIGHIFKSQSDNEVIIHSYEEWGNSCLDKLRGMFSFCIWNDTKKEFFLARDRFGIKPLYYYFKDSNFIFASEVKAILATNVISKELNLKGIENYLRYGGLNEPQTIFKYIYSLPAGHFMMLRDNTLKIYSYYDLLDKVLVPSNFENENLFEKLKSLLKETIKLYLFSDVPLAIFLSGGIDSSSLVNLASEVCSPVKTISLIFKERYFNEEIYSDLVATRFNTEHKKFFITQEDVIKELDNCIEVMDEPTFDGINIYFISKLAKELGFKICLSGLGGDELFCGYSTFKRVYKLLYIDKFLKITPDLIKKLPVSLFRFFLLQNVISQKLLDLIKYEKPHPYFWMRQLFTEEQIKRILNLKRLDKEEKNISFDKLKKLDPINQISYLEITNYMLNILLRDTDFMSMAHSVEVRVPYLDYKLVEFILRIPAKFKIDRKISKILLIKSLDKPLPKEVYLRPKKGFVFPFEIWMKYKLKDKIEEIFFEKYSFVDNLLNNSEIVHIWKAFLNGKLSWQRPWALYVLKRWLNRYLQ
ncbi:MAG: asparagine synthase (glutamine-hydrolyzing) [Candidatus Omnitrophica bacterium]|nr:asparagine synthase (glutamine-hydrolyzing) [Candidatus Omnitrophota bacterium]